MKPTVKVIILVIATSLICGHSFAQITGNNKFVLIPSFPAAVVLNAQAPAIEAQTTPNDAAGLFTIFSNLGKRPNCYDPSTGWLVAGKNSPLGESQYIAMKFTPESDATVTELKLALLWLGGKHAVVISLNEDSNGLPGNPIHTWVTSKQGKSGKPPCIYTTVKSKRGLPVQQGTQYWVVASGRGTELNAWSFTFKDTSGDLAYDIGDAGWKIEDASLSAFAVLGTQ